MQVNDMALETMIFNTVIRAFNDNNVPPTTASLIMRSVAGRIDNMALQALTEENFQLQQELSKVKKPEEQKEEAKNE